MHNRSTIAAAALALSFAAGTVKAQESGWYGGLDIGRSKLGASGGDFENALARQGIGGTATNDNADTAWGMNLGYRVNRHLAFEGAYTDLGKFSYSVDVSAPTADGISGSYSAKAYSVSAVGIVPLQSSWSIYGKAGLARTSTKLTASSVTGATSPEDASDSGTGLLVGAGLRYDLQRSRIFMKAGWDRYVDAGAESTGKADIDLYSVGVGYRF
jgi:OmpA-OmpF porin, OOP family